MKNNNKEAIALVLICIIIALVGRYDRQCSIEDAANTKELIEMQAKQTKLDSVANTDIYKSLTTNQLSEIMNNIITNDKGNDSIEIIVDEYISNKEYYDTFR